MWAHPRGAPHALSIAPSFPAPRAAKLPNEGALLLDACVAMCDFMTAVGVAVDGGKDSLSMAAKAPDGEMVKAPGASSDEGRGGTETGRLPPFPWPGATSLPLPPLPLPLDTQVRWSSPFTPRAPTSR